MHARKLGCSVVLITTLMLSWQPAPLLAADPPDTNSTGLTVRHAYVEAYMQSQP